MWEQIQPRHEIDISHSPQQTSLGYVPHVGGGPMFYRLSSDYFPATSLTDTLSGLLAPYSASSGPHDRVVQYAPRYRLAFTLLNEDAASGQAIHGWDIQDAIARELCNSVNIVPHLYLIFVENLFPNLLKLSILHNFTIESQVQFHAPLAFKPTPISTDDGDAYGLTPEDLTVFINSAEWTLCGH
jgi:GPI-anchor transamidase subunit S